MNHVLSVVHGIEMLAVGFRIVIQKLIAYETEDERRSLTPKILVGQHTAPPGQLPPMPAMGAAAPPPPPGAPGATYSPGTLEAALAGNGQSTIPF